MQSWQFVGKPQNPRAKRFHDSTWDRYKPVIRQKYWELKTERKLHEWILASNFEQFAPSSKQLRYRLKKWTEEPGWCEPNFEQRSASVSAEDTEMPDILEDASIPLAEETPMDVGAKFIEVAKSLDRIRPGWRIRNPVYGENNSILPNGLTPGELEVVREAADVFLQMVCENQAFAYYMVLWLSEKSLGHLLSCATTSHSEKDLQWVQGILEAELDGTDEYHQLLIRMELILGYYRLDDDKRYEHIEALRQTTFLKKREPSLDEIPFPLSEVSFPNKMLSSEDIPLFELIRTAQVQLDLPAYYLIHVMSHCIEDPNTRLNELRGEHWYYGKRLETAFLEQNPGPFALSGTLQNQCLRNLLDWCREQLKEILTSSMGWEIHRPNATNKMWTNFITVFALFWVKWKKEIPQWWTSETERTMGLSAIEMLGVFTSFIQKNSPRGNRFASRDVRLFLRCEDGANRLAAKNDHVLSTMFLQHYIRADNWLEGPKSLEQRSEVFEMAEKVLKAGGDGDLSFLVTDRMDDYAPSYTSSAMTILRQLSNDISNETSRVWRSVRGWVA